MLKKTSQLGVKETEIEEASGPLSFNEQDEKASFLQARVISFEKEEQPRGQS